MLQENNAQSTRHIRYRTVGQALFLMLICFVIWTPVAVKTEKEFSIRPTTLLLKAETCNFLHQNHLSLSISNIDSDGTGSCTITVPFNANQFEGDVVIHLDNQHFRIAQNQLLAMASPDNQPWMSSQVLWVCLLAIASILLGSTMIGIIVLLASKKAGGKP
jgi:hypothetical protein